MLIAGLQKTSTLDFPGKLSAVIFSPGCNYSCFYCHNRQLLGQNRPPLLKEEDVSLFLEKRRGLLDGIVFSGGEPTLHRDLSWWMNNAKKLGFSTKLDTNGSRPEALAALLSSGLVDYVAMDYKAPLDMYTGICHAPADGVMESMKLLISSGVEFELRTTLVPQLGLTELLRMAQAVPKLPLWALQLYREQPGDAEYLAGLSPYRPEELRAFAEALRPAQPNVTVRA